MDKKRFRELDEARFIVDSNYEINADMLMEKLLIEFVKKEYPELWKEAEERMKN
jgi:hypothetical protein